MPPRYEEASRLARLNLAKDDPNRLPGGLHYRHQAMRRRG